jgi:hypothetical protein
MKFFSNEGARQGDETYDEDRARAEAQGTVPQQRAGSPWSAAPGDTRTEAESAEQEQRDGSAVVDYSHASDRDDQERDHVRDDADRTVVIDSAADRRDTDLTDRRDTDLTDDRRDADDDVTDRMAGATPDTNSDSEPTADLSNASGDDTPDDSPVDLALDDDKRTTTTYGPDGSVTDEERPADEAAIRDEGTFESPTVVEPDSGETAETEPVAASAPVATESKPAAVDETPDRLFPEGDDLADQFRDIQLRFVDNPKEATAEAATLVDDALDKLVAALKSRRGDLSSNSDDTEKLRVEIRGYRELLNRVLKL